MTRTATDGAGAPGSESGEGGPGAGLRDRSRLLPTPESYAAGPMLVSVVGVALSLALLSVAAVVVPVPDWRVGPVASVPGYHDFAVLQFLALVGGAGGALSVGLLRGAVPRTEAMVAGPAVDRTALRIGRTGPVVARVLGSGALIVATVIAPAWLGLLPIAVVGLVLPFAVALCTPSVVLRRLVSATEDRRGLRVVATGALAAATGHMVLAGPKRPADEAVVLEGELLPAVASRGQPVSS